MLNTSFVPARTLQKAYKSIINGVKTKNEVVVLTTNKKPQAAIVSLEDLENLKKMKNQSTAKRILDIADKANEELTYLSSNLRLKADEILYGKGHR